MQCNDLNAMRSYMFSRCAKHVFHQEKREQSLTRLPNRRNKDRQKLEAKRRTKPKKKRATSASKAGRQVGEQSGGSPCTPKSWPPQGLPAREPPASGPPCRERAGCAPSKATRPPTRQRHQSLFSGL
jgi:hypothetical protein